MGKKNREVDIDVRNRSAVIDLPLAAMDGLVVSLPKCGLLTYTSALGQHVHYKNTQA